MKTLFFLMIFIAADCLGQVPKISTDWEKQLIAKFESRNLADYQNFDFSEIISNQLRIDRDPWSSYIGVFGPNNRRIDFHLIAKKVEKTKYVLNGKSKLGSNIRELTGEIHLRKVVQVTEIEKIVPNVFILTFDYKFDEPGDRSGDGSFIGIGSVIFEIRDEKAFIFWSESGDYIEYNHMFVGIWNRKNSNTSLECIFSFEPSGTYMQLPYREYLYKEFETEDECQCFYEIKDEYRKFGWDGYDDGNIYKDYWWK